jgi:hypothetical protein
MAGFGSFFKGEKKKKKKGTQNTNISHAPVFVPPTVIGKKKPGEQ